MLELVSLRLSEFGIRMENGIVALTTDGAPAMRKLGRIAKVEQQLCLAHGIQLAVLDTLYARPSKSRFQDESDDEDQSDYGLSSDDGASSSGEEEDDGLHVEGQLAANDFASSQIRDAVNAVRRLTKIFSPGNKNETLQVYVRQINDGNELQLKLDCRTRWSSLYDMLERYWRIRSCVHKALIDIKSDFHMSSVQTYIISCLLKALEPVHTTVMMLCRRNCNLNDARVALKFMLETLQIQDNPIGQRLFTNLKRRILERWTINASLLHYLTHGPTSNDEISIVFDYEQKFECENEGMSCAEVFGEWVNTNDDIEVSQVFGMPKKKVIADHICKLLSRMNVLTDELVEDNETDQGGDPKSKRFKSFEEVLNFVVKDSKSKTCKPTGSLTGLSKLIHQEMANFDKSTTRGVYLQKCYDMLATIKPTSVESERAFSAGGYFCSKIRSKLAPSTIDTLCFIRHFVKHNTDV